MPTGPEDEPLGSDAPETEDELLAEEPGEPEPKNDPVPDEEDPQP